MSFNKPSNIIGKGSFGTVVRLGNNKVEKRSNWLTFEPEDAFIVDNTLREAAFYQSLNRLKNSSHQPFHFSKNIPDSLSHIAEISRNDEVFTFSQDYLGVCLSNFSIGKKSELWTIVFQIAQALDWFQQNNLSHGDLKPDNILVRIEDEKIKVTLIDFGSVCFFHSPKLSYTKSRCTLVYCSPEELDKNQYSIYNDIWSLGTIIFELVTGKIFAAEVLRSFAIDEDIIHLFINGKLGQTKVDFPSFLNSIYSQLNFSNINAIVQHHVKDQYTQHIVLHCLLKDPEIRISPSRLIGDLINSKKVNGVEASPKLAPMVPIEPFDLVEYQAMAHRDKMNVDLRKSCLIHFKHYVETIFSPQLLGHSVMLFDRFNFRFGDKIDHLPFDVITFIFLSISASILLGKTFSISKLSRKVGITRKDFINYYSVIIDLLGWQLFNLSPDLIVLQKIDRLPSVGLQLKVYEKYVVNSQTSEKLAEKIVDEMKNDEKKSCGDNK